MSNARAPFKKPRNNKNIKKALKEPQGIDEWIKFYKDNECPDRPGWYEPVPLQRPEYYDEPNDFERFSPPPKLNEYGLDLKESELMEDFEFRHKRNIENLENDMKRIQSSIRKSTEMLARFSVLKQVDFSIRTGDVFGVDHLESNDDSYEDIL